MNYKAFEQKKQFIIGKNVVGIDPAKSKHQLALVNPDGISLHGSFTVSADHNGFTETLWKKLKKRLDNINKENIVFAIETSCNLWNVFAHYLHSNGWTVLLVSPLTTYQARPKMNHDYSKTDPKDALIIANETRAGHFDFYRQYSPEINAMHDLSISYDKLRKDVCQYKGRIRGIIERVFPEYLTVLNLDTKTSRYLLKQYFLPYHYSQMDIIKEAKAVRKLSNGNHKIKTLQRLKEKAKMSIGISQTEIEETMLKSQLTCWLTLLEGALEQQNIILTNLLEITEQTPYFNILKSIKGISDITAALFIAETRDLAMFKHPKQIEKMAGFNLRQSQSGNIYGSRRISRIGNKRLRWVLYRMAEETKNHIPEVRKKYLIRQLKRKCYRKNVVAAIPVLLRLIMNLIKENREYEFRESSQKELEKLEKQYEAKKTGKKRQAA